MSLFAIVVVGRVVDNFGLVTQYGLTQGRDRPEVCSRSFAVPADSYNREQAARIPVDASHDGAELGQVVYLERADHGLWAVAEIDDATKLPAEAAYWSPTFTAGTWNLEGTAPWDSVQLSALSLVEHPATTYSVPVSLMPGRLRDVALRDRHRDPWVRELLHRAKSHKGGTAEIADTRRTATTAAAEARTVAPWGGEIEIRNRPALWPPPRVIGRPPAGARARAR